MMPVFYIIMVIAAGGMLWAHQQFNSKGVAWGRPLAGFFGVLAVAMAISAIVYQFKGQAWQNEDLMQKELRYQRTSMTMLGKAIAEGYSGKNLLVVTPQVGSFNKERHEDLMKAFREGLGPDVTIAEEVSVNEIVTADMEPAAVDPNMDPNMDPGMEMMDMMLEAKHFDKLVEDYPQCDMIFSMVGLPWDYAKMRFWKIKSDRRPLLVLQNADLANDGLQHFMTAEKTIVAVLMPNPDAKYDPDADVPEDLQTAFDQRYILVTPDNIEEMKGKYPMIFGIDPATVQKEEPADE